MAVLTVQQAALTGLNSSYGAAAGGGDQFANTGKAMLHVKNGASSKTVTVDSQTPCSQGVDHDAVVAIPAGEERMIGPFPKARFDDANGDVQITYSAVTSVTVAVVELP